MKTSHPEYAEVVGLPDGSCARIRWLMPHDRRKLLQGFAELSPRSRHLRCLGPKKKLTAEEADFLTQFDPGQHAALCAVRWDERHGREGEGLGAARYVRLRDQLDVVEIAVTVIDSCQGLGIGSALVDRLVRVLPEYGIDRVHAHWERSNVAVQRLLSRRLGAYQYIHFGETVVGDFALPRVDRAA